MHDTIDALHSKSLKVSKDKRNTSGSDLTVTSIKDKDMLNDEWSFTGYVYLVRIEIVCNISTNTNQVHRRANIGRCELYWSSKRT